jgi:FtsP/CotA-like multicopper oxidase with cupredoxin domain
VKAFPAKTEGKSNQLLTPRMEPGVKVYDLTCSEVQWEISPGKRMKAWVYEVRVREGDRVRINVRNQLTCSASEPSDLLRPSARLPVSVPYAD